MNVHYIKPEQQLADKGTLIYSGSQIPLSPEQWQTLAGLIDAAEYDHVVSGDASEQHSVHVARFVNDVDRPRDLSPLTGQVRDIVMSPGMLAFYSKFAGTTELCMRRCQANRLQPGDFIGIHKDQDSNPDYLATVVFHFDSVYEGGDFVTHHQKYGDAHYHPGPSTLLVNNCEVPHEVTPVTAGERLTLAVFLSREFGASPVRRQAFKLS